MNHFFMIHIQQKSWQDNDVITLLQSSRLGKGTSHQQSCHGSFQTSLFKKKKKAFEMTWHKQEFSHYLPFSCSPICYGALKRTH